MTYLKSAIYTLLLDKVVTLMHLLGASIYRRENDPFLHIAGSTSPTRKSDDGERGKISSFI